MATSQRGVRSARPKHAGAVLAARVAHRCVARSATGVGLHHAGRVPARDEAARLDADCFHLTLRHRPTGCARESHPRVAPEAWAVLLRPPLRPPSSSSCSRSSSSTAARGSPSSWPPRARFSARPTESKSRWVCCWQGNSWKKQKRWTKRDYGGAHGPREMVLGSGGCGASGRRGTWPALLGDGATPCDSLTACVVGCR